MKILHPVICENPYFYQPIKNIVVENNTACGVVLEDGTEIRSKVILSNATPKVTFLDLLAEVGK